MRMDKVAANDAFRWARAEMFFGTGAGTRRKLLEAEIAHKVETISGYNDAFNKAYNKQNFADHAIAAAKERKRIDRGLSFKRNSKGLLTGNRRQLTGVVLTGVFVWGVLHETGLDEPIKAEVKKRYKQAKIEFNAWNARRKLAADFKTDDESGS